MAVFLLELGQHEELVPLLVQYFDGVELLLRYHRDSRRVLVLKRLVGGLSERHRSLLLIVWVNRSHLVELNLERSRLLPAERFLLQDHVVGALIGS